MLIIQAWDPNKVSQESPRAQASAQRLDKCFRTGDRPGHAVQPGLGLGILLPQCPECFNSKYVLGLCKGFKNITIKIYLRLSSGGTGL